MGNYLPNPNLKRHSELTKSGSKEVVVSSMQGWRADMEDAHLAIFDLISGVSLFGIFDGHGGPEVARYVADHLPGMLRQNQDFLLRNFKKGIVQVYKELDEQMRKEDYVELKPY